MNSLAKFDVKCRVSLQNTVSASKSRKEKKGVSACKRCKDWKMHS